MKKEQEKKDTSNKQNDTKEGIYGDDAMSNVNTMERYATLDLKSLLGKKGKIVSSEEALKNVTPIDWGNQILNGEEKIIVTNKKKRGL